MLLPHVKLHQRSADPAFRRVYLQNAVFVRHADKIHHVGMCQALCQLAAHFALRQDNTVRTDALEHLGMHSASRFGNDVLRAQILEHDCDEDARLHIRTYRNNTAVEVAHADGPQHGFVLRVALHDLRHIIRDALHALGVLVDGKNLLTKLGQLLRNGGTESAHADHQKGFHICLSFG